MTDKRNIFLIGPMGAGKSTIGRQLSQHLNMDFFDSDKEIEKRTGATIDWVLDKEGENRFRKREEKIIDEITKKHSIVLATGGGSVKSHKIRNYLSNRGIVIYLKTTIEKQIYRTKRGKKRSLLQVKETPSETFKKLEYERNPLYEEIADITIRTDEQSAKFSANQIINILKEN